MTSLQMIVGEKIKNFRKIKGMTQQELGFKANLKQGYLGDVERGARNISLESLEKIINALGLRPGDIFGYHEVNINDVNYELEQIIQKHSDFLRTKKIKDVKMLHKISLEIFDSLETN
ncbi:helix-turn-helix transcriptional regulator [Paenibacillus sp. CGMCC 1.16610]|uniref:Helix-turn-helix domain-containing protein n=1 Tax=Paenibacillus anseongense TaxID=2682845 RepID=A0ABW9UI53_9BACL|nr:MULTISPECIES: helix-turn-helix transcriptional regulator [Paenibacillus]MBA2941054.1 helix-turn-helix transcriptional regulator [Paenibacillus sp. CGMCC 1.16610]MVQ39874.1 helix-turn-helix domain-containing protein [Paenibacillus anseongense]